MRYKSLGSDWSSSASVEKERYYDIKEKKDKIFYVLKISSPHCCGGFRDSTSAAITLSEAEELLKALPSLIEEMKRLTSTGN